MSDQMDLIDVHPENIAKIVEQARLVSISTAKKKAAAEDEKAAKQELLNLVEEANLEPLDDGTVTFTVDGMRITVKPREDSITVKESGKDGYES